MKAEMEWVVTFELENGGVGPDTVSSDGLAAEFDAIVVLLLRDHDCQTSRKMAEEYNAAINTFVEKSIAVIAVLPDEQSAAHCRELYDLAFPILSDSPDTPITDPGLTHETELGTPTHEVRTDGKPRFDAFARIEAQVDTLPAVGILIAPSKFTRLIHSEGGDTIHTYPSPEETLSVALEKLQ